MLLFTPVVVVTGLLFCNILPFRRYMLLYNASKWMDATHVIAAYVFAIYLLIHVYMSTLGRNTFSHIKAMILGYEEEPDEVMIIPDTNQQPDRAELMPDLGNKEAMVLSQQTIIGSECPGGRRGGDEEHG